MERQGTVAILGVGLIGSSIGLALRARGLATRVVGIGRNPARLDEAQELGAVDATTTDLRRGLADADVAVVCTPVDRVADDVLAVAAAGPDRLLVTDAGSTKRLIVEAVEADPRAAGMFVAAHPIAGSERSGARHGRFDLFEGRVCVLTPTSRTVPDRLDRVRSFWKSLGMKLIEMAPDDHDRALALSSHLPHAVASALAAAVPGTALPLTAGAYRDGTRVAAADPGLWTSIFLANRGPVLEAIAAFEGEVAAFRAALEAGDAERIREWWSRGHARRLGHREPADGPR